MPPPPPPNCPNTSFRRNVLLQVMLCRAGSSTQPTLILRSLSLSFGYSREFALLPLHVILATSLVIFTRFSWRGDTKPRVPETRLHAFIHNVVGCRNARLILRYWFSLSVSSIEVKLYRSVGRPAFLYVRRVTGVYKFSKNLGPPLSPNCRSQKADVKQVPNRGPVI